MLTDSLTSTSKDDFNQTISASAFARRLRSLSDGSPLLLLRPGFQQSDEVRYTPPILTLIVATIAFAVAVWLLVADIRAGPVMSVPLVAVAVALASFLAAAWAAGRIRRMRSVTPEAIISGDDQS